MTRHQTSGIALVAMLTACAAAPTASAQVCGSYPSRSTRCSPACAPPTRYQPGNPRTRYRETPQEIQVYFQRKFTNIANRYMLYSALVRARLTRDTEIMNMQEEFANTIQWNLQRAERFRQQRTPERLAASTYDPSTGVISWPWLLQEDRRFVRDREVVERMFAPAARYDGRPGSRNCSETLRSIERMKSTLLAMLRDDQVDGTTYATAKNFLKSLAHETRLLACPAVASLAVNQPFGTTTRNTGQSHVAVQTLVCGSGLEAAEPSAPLRAD